MRARLRMVTDRRLLQQKIDKSSFLLLVAAQQPHGGPLGNPQELNRPLFERRLLRPLPSHLKIGL